MTPDARAALAETLVKELHAFTYVPEEWQLRHVVARVLAQEEPPSSSTEWRVWAEFVCGLPTIDARTLSDADLREQVCKIGDAQQRLQERADAAEARLRQCKQECDELARINKKWLIDYGMYRKSAIEKIEALEAAHGRLRTALEDVLKSARPNRFDHPAMWDAWQRAEAALTPSPEEPK